MSYYTSITDHFYVSQRLLKQKCFFFISALANLLWFPILPYWSCDPQLRSDVIAQLGETFKILKIYCCLQNWLCFVHIWKVQSTTKGLRKKSPLVKVWDKNAKLTISSCSFFLVKNALFSKISFGVLYNIKICFTFTEKKLILKDNKFFWGLEIRCKYGLLTPRTLSRNFFFNAVASTQN